VSAAAMRWADAFARTGRERETLVVMGCLLALSIAASALGPAAPALLVVAVPLALHVLFVAKPHEAARTFFTVALFLEPPELVPGCGYWTSPLDAANHVFYDSVKNLTGLPGASLPLSFLGAVVILVRARREPKPSDFVAAPRWALRSIYVFLGALAALEAWGLARGGALEPSFRQVLQMATFGLLALAFLSSVRGPKDVRALGAVVVAVAVVRSLLVAFVYLVICRPRGIEPAFCTTHADSVTFDAAALILFADALEGRTRRSVLRAAGLGALLLAAMVMNNRRLAFVGLGAGAVAMVCALPKSREKTRALRALVPLGLVAALYLALSAGTSSPLFAPGRLALSAIAQDDTSSDSRTVENDNLVVTFRAAPLLGHGFGFEYDEVRKVYDISEFFPYYRYIPHNSVLWLLGVGGIVGFYFLWAPYLVHGFAAARAHRLHRAPTLRAAALASLGIVVVTMVNDWGDQGRNDVINVVMEAMAFAVAAKLVAAPERTEAAPQLDGLDLSALRRPEEGTEARGTP
jgi:hypothetical protein